MEDFSGLKYRSLADLEISLQTGRFSSNHSRMESCKVVGDSYEKVLRNVQHGRYTEKVDTKSYSDLFEVGSAKVVTSCQYFNKIHIQNRWR